MQHSTTTCLRSLPAKQAGERLSLVKEMQQEQVVCPCRMERPSRPEQTWLKKPRKSMQMGLLRRLPWAVRQGRAWPPQGAP